MTAALLLVDLQNDFLHPDGAYSRGGAVSDAARALPARLAPVVAAARRQGVAVIATCFTLVPDANGEPMVAEHLKKLRPFLRRGDFAAGSWGHAVVDELQPVDAVVEKVAYSAFLHTRLEWLLRQWNVHHVTVAGIVTNGGVASTVRDAHARGFHVRVLSDGCAAFDSRVHDATLLSLGGVAEMSTVGDYSNELLKSNDHLKGSS
ncbi:MAG: cysteine hydrolase [Acidimicrobiales bacterium mtb01]|nr:cysteine hydrolase [Actinomycetota bacterium]TEX45054.1 MAG: cysteine hydrolase [Acidimicrobiales bacterium mtb01]